MQNEVVTSRQDITLAPETIGEGYYEEPNMIDHLPRSQVQAAVNDTLGGVSGTLTAQKETNRTQINSFTEYSVGHQVGSSQLSLRPLL